MRWVCRIKRQRRRPFENLLKNLILDVFDLGCTNITVLFLLKSLLMMFYVEVLVLLWMHGGITVWVKLRRDLKTMRKHFFSIKKSLLCSTFNAENAKQFWWNYFTSASVKSLDWVFARKSQRFGFWTPTSRLENCLLLTAGKVDGPDFAIEISAIQLPLRIVKSHLCPCYLPDFATNTSSIWPDPFI